eukprot:99118-Hanusia_phi.AAC.4
MVRRSGEGGGGEGGEFLLCCSALKDNHPLTKFTNTRPQTVPMNVDEEVLLPCLTTSSLPPFPASAQSPRAAPPALPPPSSSLPLCCLPSAALDSLVCLLQLEAIRVEAVQGQGKERPRTRTELMRKRREENLQHNQKG